MFSEHEFGEAVKWFFDQIKKVEDGWSLNFDQTRNTFFLRKQSFSHLKEDKIDNFKSNMKNQEEKINGDGALIWDHHILFHPSYSVPSIYFNVYYSNGNLVRLENLWQLISNNLKKLGISYEGDHWWSFVSQQEHPFEARPFYWLHPCHTHHLVESSPKHFFNCRKKLMKWMTSVSPYVYLPLPSIDILKSFFES